MIGGDAVRKRWLSLFVLMALVLSLSATAFANDGGAPGKHGLNGREFGAAVSARATEDPLALAKHVGGGGAPEETPMAREEAPEEKGMPELHGLTGREFGQAVSALARSAPGAVAAHVAGGASEEEPEGRSGMPALHGLDGKDFGAAVSALARTTPGAVAMHVRK